MDNLAALEERKQLVQKVNDILARHNVPNGITLNDLFVTEKTVSDVAKQPSRLSDQLTESLWPSIPLVDVHHYTSSAIAERILNEQVFRLTCLEKRFGEGEIRAFCEDHGLRGYLESDALGIPRYRTLLMPGLFYASFTDVAISPTREQYLWKVFGRGIGARLHLRITAKNPNLRRIVYGNSPPSPIPVLRALSDMVHYEYNRAFILRGISRLCAFYLTNNLSVEGETRALYKKEEGFGPPVQTENGITFIELPLGEMTEAGYQVDVLDVVTEAKITVPDPSIVTLRA